MSILGHDLEALGLTEGQRAAVDELLRAERQHATRWWTCLDELRRRRELPVWAASGTFGSHAEHDAWLASRAATDGLLSIGRAPTLIEITV